MNLKKFPFRHFFFKQIRFHRFDLTKFINIIRENKITMNHKKIHFRYVSFKQIDFHRVYWTEYSNTCENKITMNNKRHTTTIRNVSIKQIHFHRVFLSKLHHSNIFEKKIAMNNNNKKHFVTNMFLLNRSIFTGFPGQIAATSVKTKSLWIIIIINISF